jgi:hypothetical protein
VLDIPNGLARGVRAASDFLMALQLTGAAKADSIANMQLRLPVVVIGGGLTAIDTATESLAYYVVQVGKFLARYEALAHEIGEDAVRAGWDDEEREIAEEFLATRAPSAPSGRPPRGRARTAYHRTAASLGRRHHRLPPRPHRQPVVHAEPRGSRKGAGGGHLVRRGLTPVASTWTTTARSRGIRRQTTPHRASRWLPARTVFVAAGTQPNTVLAREDPRRASRWTASTSPPSTRRGSRSSPKHALPSPGSHKCCCRATPTAAS